ncbi:TAXI family TRAP transporter solute-binding subunit [Vineibacter terrae]|uniref:TAXI family TRAP transporter solute-binding subunit n=1 Tax=Vineibacter terrae TaxID=2586908 RepID=A0A5C8PFV3_9HYPH|nr:TAXI family TRAP transporter solute-binding subunit [Vineibacter terrae]TXL72220.1 TAXI family TRAP transporter solute-binding subunit [Vineibacter terrae]
MFRRVLMAASAAVALGAAGAALAQPKPMTLGTASIGGTYFIYGGVLAKLLTDKLGVNVSTQQTQGPNQNILLVDDKKVELGMTTMGVALQAWTGKGDWTKGKKFENIRALFPMYDTPFQCVALKKSGVTAFKQLDGKTVGVGPKAGTPGTYMPLIFQALGMKATIRNGQGSDMAGQLSDGILDAFCFGAGLPIAAFSQLDAEKEVVFFTWTNDEIAKIKAAMPEWSDSVIPKGTYKQQTADERTVGVYNFAIAHKDLPDDVAYAIVKAVLENNGAMVQGHEAAKETVPANAVRNAFLPFHPGAVKYYKEKNIPLDPKAILK